DGRMLNTLELGVRDLFFLRLLARLDESAGADEAADMLGAEGRLAAFHWHDPPVHGPTLRRLAGRKQPRPRSHMESVAGQRVKDWRARGRSNRRASHSTKPAPGA